MIQSLLILYAVITVPVLAVFAMRVYRSVQRQRAGKQEEEVNKAVGVGAVIVETRVIMMDEMRKIERMLLTWIPRFDAQLDSLRADSQAVIQASKAITQAMLDIKASAETFSKSASKQVSVSNFIHQLEYARDTFAKTPSQKKAVQHIISNVRMGYGTESK